MALYIDLKKTAINKLNAVKGRVDYRVNGYKYLYLRVSQSSKSFQYLRRINGKLEKKTLGAFGDVSLKYIEDRYNEINCSVASGNGIGESSNLSLKELFEKYVQGNRNKKSLGLDVWRFNNKLSKIENISISNISYETVRKLHQELKETPYEANRLLALISSMYNYAIRTLRLKVENPCVGIKKYKEHAKRRILDPGEMKRFFKTIEEYRNNGKEFYADLFLMFLLTGQRKTNVQEMRFDAVNLETGEWFLDAGEVKNNEDHVAILNSEALEIVKRRKCNNEDGVYVFPSPLCFNKPVREAKRAWSNFLKDAGIENLTIHDLRRTFGAYLLMNCNNLKTVQEMLGHKDIATTAKVYTPIVNEHKKKAVAGLFDSMK